MSDAKHKLMGVVLVPERRLMVGQPLNRRAIAKRPGRINCQAPQSHEQACTATSVQEQP